MKIEASDQDNLGRLYEIHGDTVWEVRICLNLTL